MLYCETKSVSRNNSINFHTLRSGILIANISDDDVIYLDFPSLPPTSQQYSPAELANIEIAFGIRPEDIIYFGKSLYDIFIEVSVKSFINLNKIDFRGVASLGSRGVIVTCQGRKSMNGTVITFIYVYNKKLNISLSYDQGNIDVIEDDTSDHRLLPIVTDSRYHFLSRCFFPK